MQTIFSIQQYFVKSFNIYTYYFEMHICAGHLGYYLFFSEETYCSDSNKDNNIYQNDQANFLDANAQDISI